MIGVQYKFILFQDFKRHVAESFSSSFLWSSMFQCIISSAMTHNKQQKVTWNVFVNLCTDDTEIVKIIGYWIFIIEPFFGSFKPWYTYNILAIVIIPWFTWVYRICFIKFQH
jgi:hypothetical protein